MTYRILTLDTESGAYTPQAGLPERVAGWGGLRWALRRLQAMGYWTGRGNHYVRVEAI